MVETLLVEALGPLVGGRIYPDSADADTPMPFLTYQQAGGRPVVYTDGQMADKQGARMQINVWAKNRIKASELIAKVTKTLCAAPLLADPLGGPVSLKDPVTGFKGAMQDFMIWHEA